MLILSLLEINKKTYVLTCLGFQFDQLINSGLDNLRSEALEPNYEYNFNFYFYLHGIEGHEQERILSLALTLETTKKRLGFTARTKTSVFNYLTILKNVTAVIFPGVGDQSSPSAANEPATRNCCQLLQVQSGPRGPGPTDLFCMYHCLLN